MSTDVLAGLLWGFLLGMALTDFVWRRLSRKWANLAAMMAEIKALDAGATDER